MARGRNIIRTGLAVVALALTLLPGGGLAATSCFLYLPGVTGASQDVNYPGWTAVLDFQFSFTNTVGGVNPGFTTLALEKNADASSPVLAKTCASGGYLPGTTLDVVNASDAEIYQVRLDNVWVSSMNASMSTNGIQESIGLRFGKITWTYTQYDASGDNPTNTTTAYDLLYGKVPVVLTVTGVQNPSSGTMTVTWNARSGADYQLLGSPQVNGTYAPIGMLTGTNLGPATITLPAVGNMYFYRVQEVPPP